MADALFLLAGFAFLGAGLKYIDCVYDEGIYNKTIAGALGVALGVLMGYFIGTDPFASSILLAVIIGVAITRKIDNPVFLTGAVLSLSVPLIITKTISIDWLPTVALVFGGVADEIGNDMADIGIIGSGVLSSFFHFRLSMQVVMLLVTLAGIFASVYFMAFAFFDLAYHFVGGYANLLRRGRAEFTWSESPEEVVIRKISAV